MPVSHSPPLHFRQISSSAAHQVESMARQIWPNVYGELIPPEQVSYMLDWMYHPDTIRNEIDNQGIIYLLIEKKETPIGFCSFGPLRTGEDCLIHKIYLYPDQHGQGIGTASLREIEQRAMNASASAIELRVNRNNGPAIGLYRKSGLEVVAEDCKEIGGGFVMDDYIFRKELT